VCVYFTRTFFLSSKLLLAVYNPVYCQFTFYCQRFILMAKYQPFKTDMDFKLAGFIFPIQVTWCSHEEFSFFPFIFARESLRAKMTYKSILVPVPRKARDIPGAFRMFKAKASRGTKRCSYFNFYPLYNIRKDQLYRISGSQFYERLFAPESFWDFRETGP